MKTFKEFIELSDIDESKKEYITSYTDDGVKKELRDLGFEYTSTRPVGDSARILHGSSVGGGGQGWIHPKKPDTHISFGHTSGGRYRVVVMRDSEELYSGTANSSSNSFDKTYKLRLNMAVRKILG